MINVKQLGLTFLEHSSLLMPNLYILPHFFLSFVSLAVGVLNLYDRNILIRSSISFTGKGAC